MNNPYSASQSVVDCPEELPQKFGSLFWFVAVGATLLSIGLGLIGTFVVPAFESVFVSFGAALPTPTILVTNGRHWLWVAFVVAAGLWGFCRLSPMPFKRRTRITISFFVLGIVLLMYVSLRSVGTVPTNSQTWCFAIISVPLT